MTLCVIALADDSRSDSGQAEMLEDSSSSSPAWANMPSTSSRFSPPGGVRSLLPPPQGYHTHLDSDSDVSNGDLSHSATNHNVMFGRRNMENGNNSNAISNMATQHQHQHNSNYNHNNNHNHHHRNNHHNNSSSNAPSTSQGHRYNDNYFPEAGSSRGRMLRPDINIGYHDTEEDDDGVIGYGFQGAGMGGPVVPIVDLSPVQTTTLL